MEPPIDTPAATTGSEPGTVAPEATEVVDGAAGPAAPEAPASAPPASAEGTSAEPGGVEVPFNIADVPEEHREYVERRVAQVNAAATRKFQELAQQRGQLDELAAMEQGLADESTRMEALRDLAARYDIELDFGDDQETDQPAADVGDDDLFVDPALSAAQARIDALEARLAGEDQQRSVAQQEAYQAELRQTIDGGLEALHAREFADAPALPDDVRDAVIGYVAGMPFKDGKPDIDAAIERYDALEAAVIERHIARKTVPEVATGGSATAIPSNADPLDERGREAAAMAIAARHF